MKNLYKYYSIILLLSVTLFLPSCAEDSDLELDCKEGTVRFTNTSSNPYNLTINNVYQFQISGNSFRELNLPEGQHAAKVEQVSGFILFATVRETTLNVFGCEETEWVFP